jgi:hypothetical protein
MKSFVLKVYLSKYWPGLELLNFCNEDKEQKLLFSSYSISYRTRKSMEKLIKSYFQPVTMATSRMVVDQNETIQLKYEF